MWTHRMGRVDTEARFESRRSEVLAGSHIVTARNNGGPQIFELSRYIVERVLLLRQAVGQLRRRRLEHIGGQALRVLI